MRIPWLLLIAHLLRSGAAGQYAGDIACQQCHPAQYRSFRQTGMARSISKPGPGSALAEFAQPSRVVGKRDGQEYRSYVAAAKAYHASAEGETHELVYAIGSGDHGRSYVVRKGESLFLSPLSYYSTVKKWDLSPGYAAGLARDFTRPVSAECLGCHSSLPRAMPIGCESCHGPGAAHAASPAAAIVNPAKLPAPLRDDVCNRCHMSGDIRVVRPGRTEQDFRPGMALDEVVSVFSVPAAVKRGGSEVLGQVQQARMSRCWIASGGKVGCITCHDSHAQPSGGAAAAFFRGRCLSCHKSASCTASARERRATSPVDNCVSCHMPASPLAGVAHTAHTDHRIRRIPEMEEPAPAGRMELTWESRRPGMDAPDLRARALAYAAAARALPALGDAGRNLLNEAARQFPQDSEVQAALALALSGSASRAPLEKALVLGARPVEVRRALAILLTGEGGLGRAANLVEEALKLAPHDGEAMLQLADIYRAQGNEAQRAALLERLRQTDPGHPGLRGGR